MYAYTHTHAQTHTQEHIYICPEPVSPENQAKSGRETCIFRLSALNPCTGRPGRLPYLHARQATLACRAPSGYWPHGLCVPQTLFNPFFFTFCFWDWTSPRSIWQWTLNCWLWRISLSCSYVYICVCIYVYIYIGAYIHALTRTHISIYLPRCASSSGPTWLPYVHM